jgi:hypothetical protein
MGIVKSMHLRSLIGPNSDKIWVNGMLFSNVLDRYLVCDVKIQNTLEFHLP